MRDNHADVITTVIDGETYRLKLGPSAFRLGEKRGTVITADEMNGDAMGLATMTKFFHLALLPDNPQMTEDEALALLASADDEFEVIDAVVRAVRQMQEQVQALGKRYTENPAEQQPVRVKKTKAS